MMQVQQMLLDSAGVLDAVAATAAEFRAQQMLLDSEEAVDRVLSFNMNDSRPADAAGLGWCVAAVGSNCGRRSSPADPAGLNRSCRSCT
jgi:hypothetical protein